MFHKTTPELQDQVTAVCKTKIKTETDFLVSDRYFVLRPTVSHHITAWFSNDVKRPD